jgi:hypothetical protein
MQNTGKRDEIAFGTQEYKTLEPYKLLRLIQYGLLVSHEPCNWGIQWHGPWTKSIQLDIKWGPSVKTPT